MDSPLARVILAVFGGYAFILLCITAYDWIRAEYPSRPDTPLPAERIQHPLYHPQAVDALKRYSGLPAPERDAIKENLASGLISMEQWLIDLGQSDVRVICLGEFHRESTRQFLAEAFFAMFKVDVLMLEATPKTLKRLIARMNAGRTYFPLLGADILKILRTVRSRNPDIRINGIEETEKQQAEQRGQSGARDRSIARNFWERFRPGMRHIVLFGALHCTNEPNWLYRTLRDQAPLPLKGRMINVQVLGEHQNGPLEAFVFFLDQVGIEKENIVIADTGALHPRIYELFPLLNRRVLKKFRAVIVFRSRA